MPESLVTGLKAIRVHSFPVGSLGTEGLAWAGTGTKWGFLL